MAGSHAYVGVYPAVLRVVDLDNPAAPTEVGSVDTAGEASGFSLSNGTVVLADRDAGLALFDDCRAVVFEDGFEALGASAWSAVQP